MDTIVQFFTTSWLPLLISAAVAYLLGSLNFGIIWTKLFRGVDVRDSGSGNAGATNVLRTQGKGLAALTAVGDIGKCVAAVLLAEYVWFPLLNMAEFGRYGAYIAGLFCIIGHMYPLYFGFRGGKGVLTVLGMMLILDWVVALIGLGVFIIMVAIWRMVSLGSITAGVVMVLSTFVKLKYIQQVTEAELLFCTGMIVVVASLAIAKHSSNIKRILNGTEHKFGSKKK
ncbi:MAG: glycerol-3-phosphate 1-O-acyltransferase PlsY [Clostridia bacterium]|nr:glycerol-3-phosphate 1-O-acyltransferase PlsY [Clostridia bacterium]